MRQAIAACPLQPGKLMGYDSTSVTAPTGLLGSEYIGWDATYNKEVVYRVVKNDSGGALYSRELATFQATAGENMTHCEQANADGAMAFPICDGYPSAGIPNGEYFLVIVKGPAVVKTPDAAGARNVIAVNGWVVSGTTGRCQNQDLSGATAPLAAQIQHRVGRALTACTTNSTATAFAITVTKN